MRSHRFVATALPRLSLLLAAFALVGMALLANREGRRQSEAREWVEHTYRVLAQLDRVPASLATAESALRGFALHRDEAMLERFEPALSQLNEAVRGLRELTRDNVEQQQHLDTLVGLVDKLTSLFREDAARVRSGNGVALNTDAARVSRELHAVVSGLTERERGLLAGRSAELNRLSRSAQLTVGLATGASLCFVAVALWLLTTEIARRRRVERELNAKQSMVESIIEGTADTVYVKDLDGRYLLINSAGAATFGKKPEDVIGKTDRDFFNPEMATEIENREAAVARSGQSVSMEETVIYDGATRLYHSNKSPQRDADGDVSGVIAISRDVTHRRAEEEARFREINLMLEMGELLQACRTSEEAYEVIGLFAPRFLDGDSGAVCLSYPSRNLVESRVVFGELMRGQPVVFPPDDCWGLRRGQPHFVEEGRGGMPCRHFADPRPKASLCLPLLAHGEVLGVLHLASHGLLSKHRRHRAGVFAEQVSLALANLQLRESLRNQSIRDPLTGLFNRRYTEETLDREVHRAAREKSPLTVMMIDVDHFKKFNDSFGHDAGDQVLRELGLLLKSQTRGGDVVSRIGGEELVVIVPGASLEQAVFKADSIRAEVEKLEVRHQGKPLGPVSISVGVATFPDHGKSGAELLRSADACLYRAKNQGRNRVVRPDASALPRIVASAG